MCARACVCVLLMGPSRGDICLSRWASRPRSTRHQCARAARQVDGVSVGRLLARGHAEARPGDFVGSVEGESATSRHKKSTATVVIDLDAWLRAIPASICALLVAGERAPRAGQPALRRQRMSGPEPTAGKWQNFKHLGWLCLKECPQLHKHIPGVLTSNLG